MTNQIEKIRNYHRAIFQRIFSEQLWKSGDSVSGPGSELISTSKIRSALKEFLKKQQVEEILDIGCGDFYWMKELINPDTSYTGIDVVEDLIAINRKLYQTNKTEFRLLDVCCDELPISEFIIARDCLQHLGLNQIESAITKIFEKGRRWIAITTSPSVSVNYEIEAGSWRPINLCLPPFNLPQPVFVIEEDEENKFLGIWPKNHYQYSRQAPSQNKP